MSNDAGIAAKASRNSRKQAKYQHKKATSAAAIIDARRAGLSMIAIAAKVGVSMKMVVDVLVESGEHEVKERGW